MFVLCLSFLSSVCSAFNIGHQNHNFSGPLNQNVLLDQPTDGTHSDIVVGDVHQKASDDVIDAAGIIPVPSAEDAACDDPVNMDWSVKLK